MDQVKLDIRVFIELETRTVRGKVRIDYLDVGADSIRLDAVAMEILAVRQQDRSPAFRYNGKQIVFWNEFRGVDGPLNLEVEYVARPRKGLYFRGWDRDFEFPELWSQGQGLEHRHWLPHQDEQRDKVIWTLNVGFSSKLSLVERGFQFMSNGEKWAFQQNPDQTSWTFEQKLPQPSYLIAMALGRFDERKRWAEFRTDDYSIALEPFAADWGKAPSACRLLAYLRWLEVEIGTPYVWNAEFREAIVDNFKHGAMENTAAVIVGSSNLHSENRPHLERSLSEIEVHELAHHWFGNSVTSAGGSDFWLHEGFATYFQWKSKTRFEGAWSEAVTRRNSRFALERQSSKSPFSVRDEKAGSLAFYDRGAWVVGMLEDHMGEALFKQTLAEWLDSNRFEVVDTEGFRSFMSRRSGVVLTPFFDFWVEGSALPEWTIQAGDEEWIVERSDQGPEQFIEILEFKPDSGWREGRLKIPAGSGRVRLPSPYCIPDPRGRLLARIKLENCDWALWNRALSGGDWSKFAQTLGPEALALAIERSEGRVDRDFDRWVSSAEASEKAAATVFGVFLNRPDLRPSIARSVLQPRSATWLPMRLAECSEWSEMQWSESLVETAIEHPVEGIRISALLAVHQMDRSSKRRADWLEEGVKRGLKSSDLGVQVQAAFIAELNRLSGGRVVLIDAARPDRDFAVRAEALRALSALGVWDAPTARAALQDVFDPNPRIATTARIYWSKLPEHALKNATEMARLQAATWTPEQRKAFGEFSKLSL